MSLELYLIRHGESEFNALGRWQGQTESPLSDLGSRQAELLGKRLKRAGHVFDAVYSSDLGRAVETASIALGHDSFERDPRLREIHFGEFEGRAPGDLSEEQRQAVRHWWRFPYETKISGGGESMACLRLRHDDWRRRLPTEGRIAVFTHGGLIRDALWRETGPPSDGQWSFWINNTSITVIRYEPDRNLITRVNDDAHTESLRW